MNRRTFLRWTLPTSVGFTGCTAGIPDTDDATAGPTSSRSTRTLRSSSETYRRIVSLEDESTVADRHRATLTATLEQRAVTADRTARLAVTLTNTAPRTRTFYGLDDVELKRGWLDKFADGGALIGPVVRPPKCIGTDGTEPGPFGASGGAWAKALRPNGSAAVVFGVVDDPRQKGCISPGTYRFGWSVAYNESGPPVGTNPATIEWGVTVRVRTSA